ncbi:MAG: hypothetical protein OEV53_16100 [Nitrospira sp.]|nr:hypothetical protein [Nitrospira sp.]
MARTFLQIALSVMLLALTQVLWADNLDYQSRGDRSEGIRPKPVGGYDIELLSVLVDFREAASVLPQTLRVRFFLKEPVAVHLTVREQRYEHYYWLDKVIPQSPWKAGFNEFSWPTGDVLRQVDPRFPIDNLGVVARLKEGQPSANELIAPAILYHTRLPSTVAAYLFTLKPASDARMKVEVFRAMGDGPIWSSAVPLAAGDQPVSIRWPAGSVPAGIYRLVVSGYFLDNNERFTQAVQLYHQPVVQ